MGILLVTGLVLGSAAAAVIGTVTTRTFMPRMSPPTRTNAKIPRPSEAEKHRLMMELVDEIDRIPPQRLSGLAIRILKRAKEDGTMPLYMKAEEIMRQFDAKGVPNPLPKGASPSLVYRAALRLAILDLADHAISDLRREILGWGFDEVAPVVMASMGQEERKASGIAMPIKLG